MIFRRLWPRVLFVALLGAAIPMAVAGWMVARLTETAEGVARRQMEELRPPLEAAERALASAIDVHKAAAGDLARALAARPEAAQACGEGAVAGSPALGVLARDAGRVGGLAIELGGNVVAEAPGATAGAGRRVRAPVPGFTACVLIVTVTAPARLLEEHAALAELVRHHRDLLPRVAAALPAAYGRTLLLGLGAGVAVAAGLALWLGIDLTRRTRRLARAAGQVGEGRLDVFVEPRERDELGDLGRAFDQMVRDLRRSRDEIAYLQTIATWQEVARRLAHEIKNPLTPIQLAVQELAPRYDGDDESFRTLLERVRGIVEREIAGLRRLVDEFHDFARLPVAVLAPFDLALVVEDARGDASGLALELAPPSTPAHVRGDRLLLRRVLANLLANAAHAKATRARVAWRTEGDHVVLEVDDDGPGVPDELRARIFDPYVTGRPEAGGTGLGLAIVKKTVLEHGGTVEVTAARSPLGGARIRIELPSSAARE